MPARRIRVVPSDVLQEHLAAIRSEAGVEIGFPDAAVAEAEEAAARPPEGDRLDRAFITIDPPGSRDLDQALHIERRGGGHRISYAIADVAAFVTPGGALDREAHARAVTVYAPDAKAPLHPPVLSEGAASLLPGQWRPAVVWTLDLDGSGALTQTAVTRAQVRSVAQHTYEDIPADTAGILREVGERRLAIERERGGVRLAVPEQEVVREQDGWTVRYRVPLPSEEHNAQVSLLTGIAAAELMGRAGHGILRSQQRPEDADLARLRREAAALRIDWPSETDYPTFARSLDPADPAHAAMMQEAAGLGRGAGYTAFTGAPPADAAHWAVAAFYAHATAPLRRLQDRFVSELCLAECAGTPVPDWARTGVADLPAAMAAGQRRAGTVERGVVDLVEAAILQGREGERFEAVVVDEGRIHLREPAVRGRLTEGCPEPGTAITVRLESADPATRTVAFAAQ